MTLRLAEEETEPAALVATQVYTPLSSTVAPRMRRTASSVSLQQERRMDVSEVTHIK